MPAGKSRRQSDAPTREYLTSARGRGSRSRAPRRTSPLCLAPLPEYAMVWWITVSLGDVESCLRDVAHLHEPLKELHCPLLASLRTDLGMCQRHAGQHSIFDAWTYAIYRGPNVLAFVRWRHLRCFSLQPGTRGRLFVILQRGRIVHVGNSHMAKKNQLLQIVRRTAFVVALELQRIAVHHGLSHDVDYGSLGRSCSEVLYKVRPVVRGIRDEYGKMGALTRRTAVFGKIDGTSRHCKLCWKKARKICGRRRECK